MTRRPLVFAALILMALVAAYGRHPLAAAPAQPALQWAPCDDIPEAECAFIQVPVDYADPDGPQIPLRLGRLPNTDPAQKRGSLLIIPGGPGPGIEIELVAMGPAQRIDEVRRYYDVYSFDPRGIGRSNPIRCDPARVPPATLPAAGTPTRAEFEAGARANAEFFRSCFELTGELMAHLTAKDTAADIERIRLAIGQTDGLVAYGASYGSSYGAAYLEDYGDRVKTMVIDAVVDHSVDYPTYITRNILSVQASFDRFARWCAGEPACALNGQDVGAAYDDAVAAAPLMRQLVPQILAGGKDDPEGFDWSLIARMIAEVAAGDTTTLDEIAGALASANTIIRPGEDATTVAGRAGLFLGVLCGDWGPQDDYDAVLAASATVARVAPRFAWKYWDLTPYPHSTASVPGCAGWPRPAGNPPHPFRIAPHPNVMVANPSYDPPTPLVNALSVWLQIPEAKLLIAEADGHQAWIVSRCAFEAQLAFLFDPASALPYTVCPS